MRLPINIEEMSEYNGDSRLYVETRLENWDDIFKLYNRFLMAFVFRGHGSEKWAMTSSLERISLIDLYLLCNCTSRANVQYTFPLYLLICSFVILNSFP